jgi:hypothetical protein
MGSGVVEVVAEAGDSVFGFPVVESCADGRVW